MLMWAKGIIGWLTNLENLHSPSEITISVVYTQTHPRLHMTWFADTSKEITMESFLSYSGFEKVVQPH